MDNAKKHCEKLQKYIDKNLGKGKSKEILAGLDGLTGEETPQQAAEWAVDVTKRLEKLYLILVLVVHVLAISLKEHGKSHRQNHGADVARDHC